MSNETGRGAGTREAAPEELSCEEALALVYEYLDGELPLDWSDAVRKHVEKCRLCYPYFDFERMFLDYVHQAAEGSERASPELERRIRDLISGDSGA
jgi:anti-sigma factor (TIGR02949 family)